MNLVLQEEIDKFKTLGRSISNTNFKTTFPLLYKELEEFKVKLDFPIKKYRHILWHYINNVFTIPKCIHCKLNEVAYRNIREGYNQFCSYKCTHESELTLQKRKQTCLKNHGGETPFQSVNIQNKIKKSFKEKHGVEKPFQLTSIQKKIKEIVQEKYGVYNPSQSEIIKERKRQTSLKKYGVNSPWKDPQIREDIKQTNLKNHGVENPQQSKIIKNKTAETNLKIYGNKSVLHSDYYKELKKERLEEKTKNRFPTLLFSLVSRKICKGICLKCNNEFETRLSFIGLREKCGLEPCLLCNPVGNTHTSQGQHQLLEFIKENYTEDIIINKRILGKLELDIYLPKLGLAFEYNGVYWHNEKNVDSHYHLNKTKQCDEKKIRLIHIFEDDWLCKREIVKSRVLDLLSKTPIRIYARKCVIKEVSNNENNQFCKDNHLQGSVQSKVKLGLYFKDNNELVSLMTFGSKRVIFSGNKESTKEEYELLRFCNKLNTSVIGGASKLFKYFIENYNPKNIITYSNRSWSPGSLYLKLGFNKIKESNPNYSYVIGTKRCHRFGFRKSILIKEGFDLNKTEHEIMLERKIYRIYDCGTIKYSWATPNI